ncbi:MAG TPA: FAD:protein FMN transferase [Firmicutes bacterium]|nr:FAD:protein FMN transferase [Bacillota bacterium]
MRIFTLITLLILTAGIAHAAEGAPRKKTIQAMGGIPINISAWGMSQDTFDLSVMLIAGRIEQLEAMMSTYRDDSEISRINRGERLAQLPPELSGLIHKSLGISVSTGGAFDITVQPLVQLWKSSATADRLPAAEEVAEVMSVVGYRHVSMEPGGVPEFDTPGVMLDLGGIAKGYFADEAVELLARGGATRAIVDCGGDVRTWQRPRSAAGGVDPKLFRVAINHPLRPGERLGVIELEQGAVVTSGNYERFYEIGGRRYCHIFDPRTGWPVEGVYSVTLLAPTGLEADALATAVFVMGPEDAPAYIEDHPDLEAVIAIDDGDGGMEVYISPGLIERFKLVSPG